MDGCLKQNSLYGVNIPYQYQYLFSTSTVTRTWRYHCAFHIGSLCRRCRNRRRNACPAGRGNRPTFGCNWLTIPVKREEVSPAFCWQHFKTNYLYSYGGQLWMHTFSLTWRVEHCRRVPIRLCGFQVTESALKKINVHCYYILRTSECCRIT